MCVEDSTRQCMIRSLRDHNLLPKDQSIELLVLLQS